MASCYEPELVGRKSSIQGFVVGSDLPKESRIVKATKDEEYCYEMCILIANFAFG